MGQKGAPPIARKRVNWVNSLLEILWSIFLRTWRDNDCIRGSQQWPPGWSYCSSKNEPPLSTFHCSYRPKPTGVPTVAWLRLSDNPWFRSWTFSHKSVFLGILASPCPTYKCFWASPRWHNRIRRAPLNSSPPRARLVLKQNDVSCSWKCWSVRSSSLWMEIDDLSLQHASKKIQKVVCFHPRKTWRMDSDKRNCNLLWSFWAWSELRHVYNDGSPASKACACHLHVPRWRRTVEWLVLIKTILKLFKWQLNFE